MCKELSPFHCYSNIYKRIYLICTSVVYNVYSFCVIRRLEYTTHQPPALPPTPRPQTTIINFVHNEAFGKFFVLTLHSSNDSLWKFIPTAMTPPTHLSAFKLLLHVPYPI